MNFIGLINHSIYLFLTNLSIGYVNLEGTELRQRGTLMSGFTRVKFEPRDRISPCCPTGFAMAWLWYSEPGSTEAEIFPTLKAT